MLFRRVCRRSAIATALSRPTAGRTGAGALLLSILFPALLSLWGKRAEAQVSASASPPRVEADAEEHTTSSRRGGWLRARPFEWGDYVVTAAALGGFYAVHLKMKPVRSPRWTKPIPVIDQPIRNLLVLDSRRARDRADALSDYFSAPTIAYPVAISTLVPLVEGADWVGVWRLNLLNLQAYSVSSLFNRLSHKLVGRSRPSEIGCADDANYDRLCGSTAQYAGFVGGHTATAMTGAGLACAHHQHADLFGGGLADDLACGTALVGASVVFVARIQADRHWLSDNLVGAALGLASGYALPSYFYYRPFWQEESASLAVGWSVLPQVSATSTGATLLGYF